ncbi:MAG: hypothetical protein CMP83_10660 [Gammaproteobacteria bacterium]|nr:hypothetical protein [Gammaproteobacteria bacterium]
MSGPAPFRPRVFLYRTLVGIFLVEALFLGFAFWKCSIAVPGKPVPMLAERCPKLGSRSQELFGIAVATVLSLLTGAGATEQSQATEKPDPDRENK